jgi:hypothetical protein
MKVYNNKFDWSPVTKRANENSFLVIIVIVVVVIIIIIIISHYSTFARK